ncbi:MAG: T9SS type A sorting domain-containing protein [Bacteroidales bacterium]|nr:T9SS type A sorting domain-containing protein [Bacteroidales bacterium]
MKKILAILLMIAACGMSGAWAAPEPAPAVAESVANVASVKGGVGTIQFNAGSSDATFNIYAITGQLLKSVKVNADCHVTVDMPKGFYIVRFNNQWSRKVVVK